MELGRLPGSLLCPESGPEALPGSSRMRPVGIGSRLCTAQLCSLIYGPSFSGRSKNGVSAYSATNYACFTGSNSSGILDLSRKFPERRRGT